MDPLLALGITIVVTLLVAGLLVWGIRSMPWIDANFKQAAVIIISILAGLWILFQILPVIKSSAS